MMYRQYSNLYSKLEYTFPLMTCFNNASNSVGHPLTHYRVFRVMEAVWTKKTVVLLENVPLLNLTLHGLCCIIRY